MTRTRAAVLLEPMTLNGVPLYSERYYAMSGTRYAILTSCRALNNRVAFPELPQTSLRRLSAAEGMRANYIAAEGNPGALERLFPDLFASFNGCPF